MERKYASGAFGPGADLSCLRQMFRSRPWKTGYKGWFILPVGLRAAFFGIARFGWPTTWFLVTIFKKYDFIQDFHRNYMPIWKKRPGDTENEKIDRQGEQKWPQGHQKWAKGHQKWAKRKPKGTKRQPRGAKREPKVSQGATKMRQRTTKMYQKIDLRKMSPKVSIPRYFLDHFGSHIP